MSLVEPYLNNGSTALNGLLINCEGALPIMPPLVVMLFILERKELELDLMARTQALWRICWIKYLHWNFKRGL